MLSNGPHTFDGVRLDELRTICEQGLRHALPCHVLGHADVNVGRREFVDVKPDILRPCVFDELLVCETDVF